MSPAAGMMLTNEIVPILNATVPRVVKAIGSEDPEELVQDAVASAASSWTAWSDGADRSTRSRWRTTVSNAPKAVDGRTPPRVWMLCAQPPSWIQR